MRYTKGDVAVCSFSLAVRRRFKSQGQPDVDFINCQAWQKTAEFVEEYFVKGQQVAVVGRMQVRNYENNEGRKIYITEVVAEEAYFADSKKEKTDSNYPAPTNSTEADGFYDVSDSSEDDLPF